MARTRGLRCKVTAPRFRFAPPSGLRQLRVKWVRRVFPQSGGQAPERWFSCEKPNPLPFCGRGWQGNVCTDGTHRFSEAALARDHF